MEINIGNGYDPSTGIFTAHEPGVYAFSANFIKSSIDYSIELNLMKNKDIIARGHSGRAAWATGFIQSIISLKKGDQVYIRQPREKAVVWGEKYCTFTGHMI